MQYEYTNGLIDDDTPLPLTDEFKKLQSLDTGYKPLRMKTPPRTSEPISTGTR
jgi:hypothetical protein